MRYQRRDAHYRRAKATGYRARSAFKLRELDDRYHLLRRGAVVLDIGAWPGGWLQVAAERVGPDGRVVGIDLESIDPLPHENVRAVQGDVCDPATVDVLLESLGQPAALCLCDAAPKLTGVRATDEANLERLADGVLGVLDRLLAPGGSLLMKLFTGPVADATRHRVAERFERTRVTRPDTTRRGSAEIYVVAQGFSGRTCG